MKNQQTPEIHRVGDLRTWPVSFDLSRRLVKVLHDLEDHQRWKYGQLPPVQLLEKLKLDRCPMNKDELARAKYFWHRRPRLLPVVSYVVWLMVALGLPFWLLKVPTTGYPLLIIWAVMTNIEIVRSVRWRRQYELSIDRLIQTSASDNTVQNKR